LLKYLKQKKKNNINKWSQKLHEKIFFGPNSYKKASFFKFNPKVAPPPKKKTLWCKNHENPSDRKAHTWAPLKGCLEKKNHLLPATTCRTEAASSRENGINRLSKGNYSLQY
jgi:hypothetical protein